jgi:anti-sigma factor RsiW
MDNLDLPQPEAATPAGKRALSPVDGACGEVRLFEFLEGRLSAAEAQAMVEHLASCRKCSALLQEWQQLDLELARGLRRPRLSEAFAQRLWERIESEPARENQQQMGAEVEARWAEFRKKYLRAQVPHLLDALGYLAIALFVGCLASYWAVTLLNSPTIETALLRPRALWAISLGTSALFLLTGIGFAVRQPVGRWLARF